MCGNQDRLEVLARTPSRPSVDVALEPVGELEPGPAQDLRVERPPVVHNDADRRTGTKREATRTIQT